VITPEEAAAEEFFDEIRKELYTEHRDQAIDEFTQEKLTSYYLNNPDVMRPAVDSIQEGNWQIENNRDSSALVFYVTAIELLLKATLLKPVLHGLIHHDALAEIMVQHILGQTGIDRYEKLLAELFQSLAGIDVRSISRDESDQTLLVECREIQRTRNSIIHKGQRCDKSDAQKGKVVSASVFEQIVRPMLYSLRLTVIERGSIVDNDTLGGL
jgi:hypothetical protein